MSAMDPHVGVARTICRKMGLPGGTSGLPAATWRKAVQHLVDLGVLKLMQSTPTETRRYRVATVEDSRMSCSYNHEDHRNFLR
jgi:hypothetical protein